MEEKQDEKKKKLFRALDNIYNGVHDSLWDGLDEIENELQKEYKNDGDKIHEATDKYMTYSEKVLNMIFDRFEEYSKRVAKKKEKKKKKKVTYEDPSGTNMRQNIEWENIHQEIKNESEKYFRLRKKLKSLESQLNFYHEHEEVIKDGDEIMEEIKRRKLLSDDSIETIFGSKKTLKKRINDIETFSKNEAVDTNFEGVEDLKYPDLTEKEREEYNIILGRPSISKSIIDKMNHNNE